MLWITNVVESTFLKSRHSVGNFLVKSFLANALADLSLIGGIV